MLSVTDECGVETKIGKAVLDSIRSLENPCPGRATPSMSYPRNIHTSVHFPVDKRAPYLQIGRIFLLWFYCATHAVVAPFCNLLCLSKKEILCLRIEQSHLRLDWIRSKASGANCFLGFAKLVRHPGVFFVRPLNCKAGPDSIVRYFDQPDIPAGYAQRFEHFVHSFYVDASPRAGPVIVRRWRWRGRCWRRRRRRRRWCRCRRWSRGRGCCWPGGRWRRRWRRSLPCGPTSKQFWLNSWRCSWRSGWRWRPRLRLLFRFPGVFFRICGLLR